MDEWKRWKQAKTEMLESEEHRAKIRKIMTARYPNWREGGGEDVVETKVDMEEIIEVVEEPLR